MAKNNVTTKTIKKMGEANKRFYKTVVLSASLARVGSVAVFFRYPLTGWIVTTILDTLDYGWALRAGLTYGQYQRLDKSLDLLVRIYLVATGYVLNWPAKELVLFLFCFRFMGDLLYFLTRKEIFLAIFMNTLDFFFPIYALLINLGYQQLSNSTLIIIMEAATAAKFVQEYLLHVNNWVDKSSRKYIEKHPEHLREIR